MTSRTRRLRLRHIYVPRVVLGVCGVLTVGGAVEVVTGEPWIGVLDVFTGAALVATWAHIARTETRIFRLLHRGNRE
ncbi:hypothetical protein [Actinomadura sp. 9N215]|uniref:hypothetical protein n=1 Tax=Actinomadura sp. 9N215 TaxID=3375150 RepID=UPI0037A733F5